MVRADVLAYAEQRRDRDGRHGPSRVGPSGRSDLYPSFDTAMMRTIRGEHLRRALAAAERVDGCDPINSFARHDFDFPLDGSYGDRHGHSATHPRTGDVERL